MSRKYKFHNPEGIYFVSFATINWLHIFVRQEYFIILSESLEYCRKEKGMELFAWCIMPSHVHLIFRAKDNEPSRLIKELKTYTSKQLQKAIEEHPRESRKEWLLWMMSKAGEKNSNVTNRQFWQQHNKPIELWSSEVFQQKVDYLHNNPVESGFVTKAEDWKFSSAVDFAGGKGQIEIDNI